jgi:hypothetical protein
VTKVYVSEDARVLIVENLDLVDENSPFVGLSEDRCNDVVESAKNLWQNLKVSLVHRKTDYITDVTQNQLPKSRWIIAP